MDGHAANRDGLIVEELLEKVKQECRNISRPLSLLFGSLWFYLSISGKQGRGKTGTFETQQSGYENP